MVIIVFVTSLSFQAIAKKAAIVIDFDTKEVLFEKNADTKNYPASLTKMMTLYIVFDFVRQTECVRSLTRRETETLWVTGRRQTPHGAHAI